MGGEEFFSHLGENRAKLLESLFLSRVLRPALEVCFDVWLLVPSISAAKLSFEILSVICPWEFKRKSRDRK
jgi:hypothetical protein